MYGRMHGCKKTTEISVELVVFSVESSLANLLENFIEKMERRKYFIEENETLHMCRVCVATLHIRNREKV